MKKTALALALVLTILVMFGGQFIQLVEANGYIIYRTTVGMPIITIESPLNNEIVSFNTAVVAFTLTRPRYNWTSELGTSCGVVYVNIIVDRSVYRRVDVNSELSVPVVYSLNLTDLEDGVHSVQLNAYCRGISTTLGYPGIQVEQYLYHEVLSGIVNFTVDTPKSTPSSSPEPTAAPTDIPEATSQPATFPATLVFVSSVGAAIAVVCLFVYFKKRLRGKTR